MSPLVMDVPRLKVTQSVVRGFQPAEYARLHFKTYWQIGGYLCGKCLFITLPMANDCRRWRIHTLVTS